jgi:hypothetical protein
MAFVALVALTREMNRWLCRLCRLCQPITEKKWIIDISWNHISRGMLHATHAHDASKRSFRTI